MKAKLVNEQQVVNPAFNVKAATAAAHAKQPYPHKAYITASAGTVIDDPEAYRLVQMGVATPADDECRERAGMTDKQIEAAIHAQIRVAKGIHPDDYERYESGEIDGYLDGQDVPGPAAEAAATWGDDDDELSE